MIKQNEETTVVAEEAMRIDRAMRSAEAMPAIDADAIFQGLFDIIVAVDPRADS